MLVTVGTVSKRKAAELIARAAFLHSNRLGRSKMMITPISHYDAKRNKHGKLKTGERTASGALKRSPSSQTEHVVYVVGERFGTTFKVGRTNNIKTRMRILNTGYPGVINCFAQLVTDTREDAVLLERGIHKYLRGRGCRLHGEWYSFDRINLSQLLSEAVAETKVKVSAVRGAPDAEKYKPSSLDEEASDLKRVVISQKWQSKAR